MEKIDQRNLKKYLPEHQGEFLCCTIKTSISMDIKNLTLCTLYPLVK